MKFWTFVHATARLLRRLAGVAKLELQRLFARLCTRACLVDQLAAMRYIASV